MIDFDLDRAFDVVTCLFSAIAYVRTAENLFRAVARLAAHSVGTASRYTRSRLPVELVASWEQSDRSAARREEARIKALPRAAKLRLIA